MQPKRLNCVSGASSERSRPNCSPRQFNSKQNSTAEVREVPEFTENWKLYANITSPGFFTSQIQMLRFKISFP